MTSKISQIYDVKFQNNYILSGLIVRLAMKIKIYPKINGYYFRSLRLNSVIKIILFAEEQD